MRDKQRNRTQYAASHPSAASAASPSVLRGNPWALRQTPTLLFTCAGLIFVERTSNDGPNHRRDPHVNAMRQLLGCPAIWAFRSSMNSLRTTDYSNQPLLLRKAAMCIASRGGAAWPWRTTRSDDGSYCLAVFRRVPITRIRGRCGVGMVSGGAVLRPTVHLGATAPRWCLTPAERPSFFMVDAIAIKTDGCNSSQTRGSGTVAIGGSAPRLGRQRAPT